MHHISFLLVLKLILFVCCERTRCVDSNRYRIDFSGSFLLLEAESVSTLTHGARDDACSCNRAQLLSYDDEMNDEQTIS